MPSITVANKLEVRDGNVIQIPGIEPTSELTSPVLMNEMRKYKNSQISVKKALCLVPGSSLEVNPFDPTQRYFVFPDGPPPGWACPCNWNGDWYAYLRQAACDEPAEAPASCDTKCNAEGFSFGWCGLKQ